jgi:hypothetical protein
MDISGEDFLSHSGFTKDQNRYVCFGDLPSDLANSDHLQVFSADSQFLIIGFGQLTPQGLNFIAEPQSFKDVPDSELELFVLESLDK